MNKMLIEATKVASMIEPLSMIPKMLNPLSAESQGRRIQEIYDCLHQEDFVTANAYIEAITEEGYDTVELNLARAICCYYQQRYTEAYHYFSLFEQFPQPSLISSNHIQLLLSACALLHDVTIDDN